MRRVFAAGLDGADQLRRSVCLAVAVTIDKLAQAAVAHDVERIAFSEEAHGAVFGIIGKFDGPIRFAVAVVINQDADVTATGYDDAAFGIDGEAIDIVGELGVGVLDDLKTGGDAQAVLDGLCAGARWTNQHGHACENHPSHTDTRSAGAFARRGTLFCSRRASSRAK